MEDVLREVPMEKNAVFGGDRKPKEGEEKVKERDETKVLLLLSSSLPLLLSSSLPLFLCRLLEEPHIAAAAAVVA